MIMTDLTLEHPPIIIGEGSTAITYAFGENKALKVYKNDSADIHYEFQVNRYLTKSGISVPEAYEIVTINGKKGIVFDRAEGNSLTSEILKSPSAALQSLKMMATLQASIHEKPAESLKVHKCSLKLQIQASCLSETEKTAILDHLSDLPSDKQLCHGDFHPDNVLICAGTPIIIDWADAASGHPTADLARTILILRFGGLKKDRTFLGLIRKWMCWFYIREYKKHRSFSVEECRMWELPLAAARLSESIPLHEKEKLLVIIRSHLKK
jgi:aminoglycoside phosphotransferase (APT) family kinase protein